MGRTQGIASFPWEGGQMPPPSWARKRRCQTPFSKGLHQEPKPGPWDPKLHSFSLASPYWSSAVSWESTCSSCDSEGWK